MNDETTNPGQEANAAAEGQEVEIAPETEVASEQDQADPSEVQADDELVDQEWDGKTYKLPKAVVPGLMRQADYTRKTQAVAEERRQVEAMRRNVEQFARGSHEHLQEIGKLVAIDQQLEQLQQVDWNELERANSQQAQALWRRREMLKEQRAELAQHVEARQQQIAFETQQEMAKRIEEGVAEVAKKIPNWSPEHGKKLIEFGLKSELTREDMSLINVNPRLVHLLHLAYIGSQLMHKQQAAAKQAATPTVAPVQQVAARRAPPQPVSDRQSMEQWMQSRAQQIRKRAG